MAQKNMKSAEKGTWESVACTLGLWVIFVSAAALCI